MKWMRCVVVWTSLVADVAGAANHRVRASLGVSVASPGLTWTPVAVYVPPPVLPPIYYAPPSVRWSFPLYAPPDIAFSNDKNRV
ncbi:hypothetical protein [Paraburkholderia sp. J67]|uniref:hypothetical protein n=1 Tax=Paraburkholderia sp. J67 TaxID=2805435 RepID=UPI002ABD3036|nr:hypothetical protein [Paraburkholderia sp. J67]